MKICIIGFGNIGKRHFEALLNLKFNIEVYLIDVYDKAFSKINDYKIYNNCVVKFSNNFEFLPKEIDLAIIATASNVRRKSFELLISKTKCNNIIFEKVLFQKDEDYYYTSDKLSDLGINAWVNCNRRINSSYIKLKRNFINNEVNKIYVSGGNWGLGCNGIHYLDLISYLTDDENISITNFEFNHDYFESKRKGFYEFFGELFGLGNIINNKFNFNIKCDNSSNDAVVKIYTNEVLYEINETKQTLIKHIGDETIREPFPMDFVSVSTSKIVEDIYSNKTCGLPSFNSSMRLHLEFLKFVKVFFVSKGFEKDICPIT